MTERTCRTCIYHDDFTWVCFNGDAEDRADFTMNDHTCPCWTGQKETERAQKEPKNSQKVV